MTFNIWHHQVFGNKKSDLEFYHSKVEDDSLHPLYENYLYGDRRKTPLFNDHKMNEILCHETIMVRLKNAGDFATNSKFVEHFEKA